jgi:hypothetical protein
MRIAHICLYNYVELSADAQEKARDWYRDGIDWEWWDSVYEDAETIGLQIDGFDLGWRSIKGKLTINPILVCRKILENHGNSTATHTLASSFLRKFTDLQNQAVAYETLAIDLDKMEDKRETLTKTFAIRLNACYLNMLQKEWEAIHSDELVAENILANDYEFLENGDRASFPKN